LLLLAAAGVLEGQVRHELAVPRDLHETAYVGSGACRRCHPAHYESFRRTFHRSMTQEATPASVLGRFDGRQLDYLGVRAQMERGPAGEFLISVGAPDDAHKTRVKIERSVGSHRYQQYLARDGDVYFRLPIAWDVSAERFIHMNEAFLTPDPALDAVSGKLDPRDYNRHVTRWNDNCVFCHNVRPNPGFDATTETFSTSVAELGVACEACHGPGGEHAARNQNPLRRYTLHALGGSDPTIRNPARLPAARSAEICGRCHGQRMTTDIASLNAHGDRFVPGDRLDQYSRPLARDTLQNGQPGLFAARFWPDGTARLTAYEYQGLLQSPCSQSPEFSCESCHAMHQGDPAGQLRPLAGRDAMCTNCHRELSSPLTAAEHSRHSGAQLACTSCHMPDLVYGLVSVHISHRIERPDPQLQAAGGRPDACTLCHVDRSRSWAAHQLGAPSASPSAPADPAAARGVSEVAYRLLAGDPIERAVAAHALGRADAYYAEAFEPQLLGLLIESARHDAYPAVRAIAGRSLRARLGGRHPRAAQLMASDEPTAPPAQRKLQLDAVADALDPADLRPPAAALSTELRALASQSAIEIGE
jgi:hypothetical protein